MSTSSARSVAGLSSVSSVCLSVLSSVRISSIWFCSLVFACVTSCRVSSLFGC